MRAVISVILIALGCTFAPITLVGFWVADEASETGGYVEDMAPLAVHPDIQDAVVDRITNKITRPLRRQALTPTENLVHDLVRGVVESDAFPAIWRDVNRAAYRRLMPMLSGEGAWMPPTREAAVGLDLTPVYDRTRDSVNDLVRKELGEDPPVLRPTIDLFSSADLVRARTAYTWLIDMKWVSPVLTLGFLAAGVCLARDRGRALIGAGLGLAASMFALAVALAAVRSVYLPDYVGSATTVEAATVVFDALTGTLRAGLRILFVAGLLVAGVTYLRARREQLFPVTIRRRPRRTSPRAETPAVRGPR